MVSIYKNSLSVPPVTEVVSEVDKRQGNAEPHGSNGEHGGEGDRSAGVLPPDEQVHKEANAKDNPRVEGCREESSSLEQENLKVENFFSKMQMVHIFSVPPSTPFLSWSCKGDPNNIQQPVP